MKQKLLLQKPQGCDIIDLHLKFKYYYMIFSGEKKEEYREIKPYYRKIFSKITFERKVYARFWKGYSAEHFYCEITKIEKGFPIIKWCDKETIKEPICYILTLNN